ncbi:hypothetical protein THAOC_12598 [Thalassiosira oceanica]|uniref:Uncharacterized protein n=1 Tax=Thalassiosira oceanica TaxID=159749 RepID=K0SJL4_THAOC|nr:hypothetical protein THAOC_12598 [Thalassiosira oceanica]|eukprot:EJK66483.1 hypothetical protein THAOC_12598 [Thalassiosira oceanica]
MPAPPPDSLRTRAEAKDKAALSLGAGPGRRSSPPASGPSELSASGSSPSSTPTTTPDRAGKHARPLVDARPGGEAQAPQPSSSSVLNESDHLKSPGIIPGAVLVEHVHRDSSHVISDKTDSVDWRSGCSSTPGQPGYATSDHLGKAETAERKAAALRVASAKPNELELAYSYYRRGELPSSLRN